VQKATDHATTHDIAWAAGIYEGEGSCFRHNNCECVAVTQKELWLLDRFLRLFGGRVSKASKGTSEWRVYGARARGFLLTIYTRISPHRKEQVRNALQGRFDYSG